MPHYRLSFIGFGNVARSLVRLLERKRDLLNEFYDITYSVTGLATRRHGFAVNPDGLEVGKAIQLVESRGSISALASMPVSDSISVIQNSQADVMFENSPVNTQTGQPALDHIRLALNLPSWQSWPGPAGREAKWMRKPCLPLFICMRPSPISHEPVYS